MRSRRSFGATILAVTLSLLMVVALSGCFGKGGKQDEPSPEPTATGEPVQLVVAAVLDGYAELIGAPFKNKYPDIEVEVVRLNQLTSDNLQDLKIWLDAIKPDIVVTNADLFPIFYQTGKLEPLDDLIRTSGYPIGDQFEPVVNKLKQMGDGEHLHGLTNAFKSQVLFYNKTLFDAAGLDYPNGSWTWDDILDKAGKIVEGNHGFGLIAGEDVQPFGLAKLLARSKGLTVRDPESGQHMVSGEAWEQLFAKVVDLYQKKMIYPPVGESGLPTAAYSNGLPEAFVEGKAGMAIGGFDTLLYQGNIENMETDWGMAPLPANSSELTIPRVFSLTSYSAHKQEAWTYIEFATDPDLNKWIAERAGYNALPVYQSILNEDERNRYAAFYEADSIWRNKDWNQTLAGSQSLGSDMALGTFISTELSHVIRGKIDLPTAMERISRIRWNNESKQWGQ